MNNCVISLYDASGDQVDTTISDSNGDFGFYSLMSGAYTLEASTNKIFGGVNATDALGIMRHFVAYDTLRGIRLAGADVDASGYVNTNDAISCMQRFTLIITSFPSGAEVT